MADLEPAPAVEPEVTAPAPAAVKEPFLAPETEMEQMAPPVAPGDSEMAEADSSTSEAHSPIVVPGAAVAAVAPDDIDAASGAALPPGSVAPPLAPAGPSDPVDEGQDLMGE